MIETQEKAQAMLSAFKELQKTAGWQILKEIVNANIKTLQDQILDGFENETSEDINRKRDKLRAYKEIIGTPDYWINKIENVSEFEDESDPYN